MRGVIGREIQVDDGVPHAVMDDVQAEIVERILGDEAGELPPQIPGKAAVVADRRGQLPAIDVDPTILGPLILFLDQVGAVRADADQRVAAAIDAVQGVVMGDEILDDQVGVVPPAGLHFIAAHQAIIVPAADGAVGRGGKQRLQLGGQRPLRLAAIVQVRFDEQELVVRPLAGSTRASEAGAIQHAVQRALAHVRQAGIEHPDAPPRQLPLESGALAREQGGVRQAVMEQHRVDAGAAGGIQHSPFVIPLRRAVRTRQMADEIAAPRVPLIHQKIA
ncbi:hypothetical protein AZA_03032 [Nitrospirillum viridazoti Y2]|nr:hypothetical protein AZA_03032 [Nitrospirillum amazonense Y2]